MDGFEKIEQQIDRFCDRWLALVSGVACLFTALYFGVNVIFWMVG